MLASAQRHHPRCCKCALSSRCRHDIGFDRRCASAVGGERRHPGRRRKFSRVLQPSTPLRSFPPTPRCRVKADLRRSATCARTAAPPRMRSVYARSCDQRFSLSSSRNPAVLQPSTRHEQSISGTKNTLPLVHRKGAKDRSASGAQPTFTHALGSLFRYFKFPAGPSYGYIGEAYGRQPTLGRNRCWISMR